MQTISSINKRSRSRELNIWSMVDTNHPGREAGPIGITDNS